MRLDKEDRVKLCPTHEFRFLCEILIVKQKMMVFELQHWSSLMLMSFVSSRQKDCFYVLKLFWLFYVGAWYNTGITEVVKSNRQQLRFELCLNTHTQKSLVILCDILQA